MAKSGRRSTVASPAVHRSRLLAERDSDEFRDTIFGTEIYESARKHGVADEDIDHAVEHAIVAGEQDDARVLYLGPDRAGNLLEVVTVARDDGSEIVIHAMRMRHSYQTFLRGKGEPDA